MSKTARIAIALLLVAVIALAFGAGFTYGQHRVASLQEGLDVVGQAWNIILADHVDHDRITPAQLRRGAIEGMLGTLDDPYASYLEAEHFQLDMSNLKGNFEGIGAYVTIDNGQLTIIAPIAGSPAEAAGIRAGDVITAINGEAVGESSLAEAILKIRGPEGTPVSLSILHQGETAPVEIEVIRSKVEVPSVIFEMKGDIAYINITQFAENTGDELRPVMETLSQQPAKGIILDLRHNPGGLVDTVVDVASYFLPGGETVLKITDDEGRTTTRNTKGRALATELPVVVLVDSASASGSEVLSGALQDHGRATIAGSTTFGKGSVNTFFDLSDGSGLYFTIARWLTPNDRLIEGQGIEPDKPLVVTGEDAVNWAIDFLHSQ